MDSVKPINTAPPSRSPVIELCAHIHVVTLPGAHRVAWHMPHRQAAGLLTHNGSCAEDPIQLPGDCTLDAYGAWPLSPAQARWSTAAQLCARRCAYCARCSAISVSLEERSCSWHSECRLDALHLLPQNFRSGFVGLHDKLTLPHARPHVGQ